MTEYDSFVMVYGGSDNELKRCVRRLKEEVLELEEAVNEGNLDTVDVIQELGDAAFFVTRAAHTLGFYLENVTEANHLKLSSRQKIGKNKEAEYKVVAEYLRS